MPHILIESGPGTGKTTSLELAYYYLTTGQFIFIPTQEQVNICYAMNQFKGITPNQIVFIAFNKNTAERLSKRLPAVTKSYTFGGLGQSIIFKKDGYQKLDKYRGEKFLSDILGKSFKQLSYNQRLHYINLLKYITCFKEELLLPSEEAFCKVQEKYNLPPLSSPESVELATRLLNLMRVPNGSIEYIDQVWRGCQLINSPRYELAIIDEGQDLSILRLEFAIKVARNLLVCGDPFQSINAFAGSDHTAFEKLRAICQTHLPLKTSFRLPPNHIKYANTIRPANIIPYKTEDGPIESFSMDALPEKLKAHLQNSTPDQHLLIARTNAEAFVAGIKLLKNRIPAKIVRRSEDQDISTILTSYLDMISKNKTLSQLKEHLRRDINKAENMPYGPGIALYEKASCLLQLAEESSQISDINTLILTLTADREGVLLSTIHKAKGAEAQYVYILYPPIAHPRATTPAEIEQEKNLEYVSETRSKYYKAYVK